MLRPTPPKIDRVLPFAIVTDPEALSSTVNDPNDCPARIDVWRFPKVNNLTVPVPVISLTRN